MLAGCSSVKELTGPPRFDQVVIRNATNYKIDDLKIKVSKLNTVFACGVVLSKSFCSNSFPAREYQGNSFTLTGLRMGYVP